MVILYCCCKLYRLTNLYDRVVRPEFTGTLAVKSGRHPILEIVHAAGVLVANDMYCCDASHFQIIQGPK
jgi:DNA mismatch repair protein MSH4